MSLRNHLVSLSASWSRFGLSQVRYTATIKTEIKDVLALVKQNADEANRKAQALILREGRRILAGEGTAFDETTQEGKQSLIKAGALFLNKLCNQLFLENPSLKNEHRVFSEESMKLSSPMFSKRQYNTASDQPTIATFRFVVPTKTMARQTACFLRNIYGCIQHE